MHPDCGGETFERCIPNDTVVDFGLGDVYLPEPWFMPSLAFNPFEFCHPHIPTSPGCQDVFDYSRDIMKAYSNEACEPLPLHSINRFDTPLSYTEAPVPALPRVTLETIHIHEATDRFYAMHDDAECCWGTPCGVLLTDLTAAGISRHLKQYHFNDATNGWEDRKRGVCLWSHYGGPCNTEMFYQGFSKHIAAVHLGSIAQECPSCLRRFSRIDSLRRHMRSCKPT